MKRTNQEAAELREMREFAAEARRRSRQNKDDPYWRDTERFWRARIARVKKGG